MRKLLWMLVSLPILSWGQDRPFFNPGSFLSLGAHEDRTASVAAGVNGAPVS